jgi:glutamyl-tRNA synthetase
MRAEQKRRGIDPGYDGRGRDLDRPSSAAAPPPASRTWCACAPPTTGTPPSTTSAGRRHGAQREIRDAVLLKSDGYPTYHLANVIDDHLMGVTHVVRAEEWVVSTPLHVLLYRAFGWTLPVFAHLPLLRNPDANKTKISKRKMDTSVESYRDQGILPEALLNFLATMGWSMPDGREVFSLEEFVAAFELERVSLGGPVFDLKRLRNLNARYLREVLPLEEVAERLAPWLSERGRDPSDEDYLLDVVDVLRPRAETLRSSPTRPTTSSPSACLRRRRAPPAGRRPVVPRGPRAEFSRLEFFDDDAIDDLLHDYVQGQAVPLGKVLMPLRVALTGTSQAPASSTWWRSWAAGARWRGSGRRCRRSRRACPTTTPSGSRPRPRRPPRPPRRPRASGGRPSPAERG